MRSPSKWHGCYDYSWKGFITPESFAHPAKFSRGLIERIFDHCLARGWLRPGDSVGDCFGGIGSGGVIAAYRGLQWCGCELEPRFVALAEANFEMHRTRFKALSVPAPRIIQGDSRAFHVLLAGGNAAVVCSPPYADTELSGTRKALEDYDRTGVHSNRDYADASPGQIGRLKSGTVDGVVCSPTYAETRGKGGGGINVNGYVPAAGRKWTGDKIDPVGSRTYQGAGGERTEGNIETLTPGTVSAVVSSPPYVKQVHGGNGIDSSKLTGNATGKRSQAHAEGYGQADGQIENCTPGSVQAVVSSPPWESNSEGSRKASKMGGPEKVLKCNRGHGASDAAVLAQAARDEQKIYGESPGQIGKENGETYWEAVSAVYQSCYQSLKTGGVIVLVVKDYVSKGKRVPLCDDTCRLLEHVGFTPLERIHAMLVKQTSHGDLFTGHTTETKSRKSFFRRLAEKKGSPAIDFEEVLIFLKL